MTPRKASGCADENKEEAREENKRDHRTEGGSPLYY